MAAKPPFWAQAKRPDKEESKPAERVTPISQLFASNAPRYAPETSADAERPASLEEWVNSMKRKTAATPEPEPEGAQVAAPNIMPVSAGLAGGSGKTKRRNASAMYLTSPLGTVGNPRTYGGNLGGR